MKTKRLDILASSLERKKSLFDCKLAEHFDTVKSANGQPLNDKRGGAATLANWDRQNDALRKLDESIKRTEAAIEREKQKISNVDGYDVPAHFRPLLADGTLIQWRKFPRFFFVRGVEKARISVRDDGSIAASYVAHIPNQDQYAIFRDVFNGLRKAA